MPVPLTYHDVATRAEFESTGFPGPLAARYKLTTEEFDSHLDAIARTGVNVSTTQAADDDVWLTFDDGGASALTIADALESRGWRGFFFITTSKIGEPAFLDRASIKELSARGHIVGSHSHSHPTYMGKLSKSELLTEWTESREILGDILGEPPTYASIPGGYISSLVIDTAAQAGYSILLTSEPDERPRPHGGLTVIGRYSVWSSTSAKTAAAYAARRPLPRLKLKLEWKAKRAAKSASPRVYDIARKLRA